MFISHRYLSREYIQYSEREREREKNHICVYETHHKRNNRSITDLCHAPMRRQK